MLLTMICESMCWRDLEKSGTGVNNFDVSRLDMRPAQDSKDALWLMQSDDPIPDAKGPGQSVFQGDGFISSKARTKLFSHFWPSRFDPRPLDPTFVTKRIPMDERQNEPRNELWRDFDWHVRNWMERPSDWVIYWPLIGHVGQRGPTEDGIPEHIGKSCEEWLELINQAIIPLMNKHRDIPIMIHSDHGTARKGSDGSEYQWGFVYHRNAGINRSNVTWADIREAERRCLGC